METIEQPSTCCDSAISSGSAVALKRTAFRTALYPTIIRNKPLLRVGVMLDDWTVPAWVADVLVSIKHSGVATVTTVILNREPLVPAPKHSTEKIERVLRQKAAGLRTLLWDRYVRSDRRQHGQFSAPFHPTDIHALLTGVRSREIVPIRDGVRQRFKASDVAAIKSDRLDVIVYLGNKNLRGDILSAAKYGIWSYRHGDHSKYRGGPAGFWAMYENNPLTCTVLKVATEHINGDQVIYRTHGAIQSFRSLVENHYWLYKTAIPLVARCLRRLYLNGTAGLRPQIQNSISKRRILGTPRNRHMLLFLMRAGWIYLVVGMQNRLKIQRDHWFLAIARGVNPGEKLAGRVAPLHPPRGRSWADPMIVQRDRQMFMFFEDYDYGLGRAHISVVELDASGRAGAPRTALNTGHHLSYPFVFEWCGTHYMVPESASVNAVPLYRAVDFPTRWEYVKDLLAGIYATDATLCEHEGVWYLFTAVSEAGGASTDELFLFVANTPLGPWSPHPLNPIVSDVRSARPGGPLFRRDGALYRPAQNSDKTYGSSLSIMKVTELTPERYAERLAYRIEPDWLRDIYGCHTITMAGDVMALDCKSLKWRAQEKHVRRAKIAAC